MSSDHSNFIGTNFVSLDCESNGLHGQVFAVGATRYADGVEIETWTARCPLEDHVDPWVAQNVLPALEDWPVILHGDYDTVLAGWRRWYRRSKDLGGRAAPVVTHIPWPVEARFLWDAHWATPFSGPYPLIDVASMLLARGFDPTSVDDYLRVVGVPAPDGSPHDPLYDAQSAALAYRHLLTDVVAL